MLGTVLQLCDPSRSAAAHLRHRAAAAAGERAAPLRSRCGLSALVLLSPWPMYSPQTRT